MVQSNEKENAKRGYSVMPEQPYVLLDKVQLPILIFLKDDLRVRYNEILEEYVRFCSKKSFNASCTTTWPYFVEHVRRFGTNLLQRKLYNLVLIYLRSIYKASEKCATPEPEVQFVSVEEKDDQDKVLYDTKAAREARWEQGQLKDLVLKRVIEDPRPVLDLGGGKDVLSKHLLEAGCTREVVNVDLITDPEADMNTVDLDRYPDHQIVANHSLYHMNVNSIMNVLKRKPRGLVMVVDSNEDKFEVKGEDYEFSGTRISTFKPGTAYRVSGTIFAVKSRGRKGQRFKNELWFTRKQWSDWGFSLYSDPAQRNPFVRKHVVLFDGMFKPSSSRQQLVPRVISLGEGFGRYENKKKVPPLYELFKGDKARGDDMNCLMGQWMYHTPKIDGISMKLMVGNDRTVFLVDKMGLSYIVKAPLPRGNVYLRERLNISFAVELLPVLGTSDNFFIYANQVVDCSESLRSTDALNELVNHVAFFNRMAGFDLVGIKDYYLVRNKVVSLQTTLPHDGVIYMMAYSRASDRRTQVHCFHKPFSGTDTIPYVVASEQMRSRVSKNEFSIFYRTQYLDADKIRSVPITRDCVFSNQIQKIMSSCVMNSSDFFGPTTVSPLMYEGYYVPKEALGTDKDGFVITHIRGDKERKDVEIVRTTNIDWLKKGVIGLTRWGNDAEDVASRFFLGLSSSRVMKLLPSNVGVQANFLSSFMSDWSSGNHAVQFEDLNKKVEAGFYESDVDDLLVLLRKAMPYSAALYFLDTLFRYPFVSRKFFILGKKVKTSVRFPIGAKFDTLVLDATIDSLGGIVHRLK